MTSQTLAGHEAFAAALLDHLHYRLAVHPRHATRHDWYMALAYAVRDRMLDRYLATVAAIADSPDGKISWFDWRLLERHADIRRFVTLLTAFRGRRDVTGKGRRLTLTSLLERVNVEWGGVTLRRPDWSDSSRSLAATVTSLHGRALFHAVFNAYWEPLAFELPPPPAGRCWRCCIDTALTAPDDIRPLDHAPRHAGDTYLVQPRSVLRLALWLRETRRTSQEPSCR
jgi:glycogen operon protein